MDTRYITPFITAVQSVCKTMMSGSVTFGKPHLKDDTSHYSDVSALIGFSGAVTGGVVLSFNLDVACTVASTFARVPLKADHPDFADALGELVNMVAGSAKAALEKADVRISLPNVVIGNSHRIPKSNHFPCVIIPCNTQWGEFEMQISMKDVAGSAPAESLAAARAAAPKPGVVGSASGA